MWVPWAVIYIHATMLHKEIGCFGSSFCSRHSSFYHCLHHNLSQLFTIFYQICPWKGFPLSLLARCSPIYVSLMLAGSCVILSVLKQVCFSIYSCSLIFFNRSQFSARFLPDIANFYLWFVHLGLQKKLKLKLSKKQISLIILLNFFYHTLLLFNMNLQVFCYCYISVCYAYRYVLLLYNVSVFVFWIFFLLSCSEIHITKYQLSSGSVYCTIKNREFEKY